MHPPVTVTLTMVPMVDFEAQKEYGVILAAQTAQNCRECKKEADFIVLEMYEVAKVKRFKADPFCKVHLDEYCEHWNRVRSCEQDGATGERLDRCLNKKAAEEGRWKHEGKEDIP